MTDLTELKRGNLAEALAMAMEPEAWTRVHGGRGEASEEDSVKVIRAIRHSVAAMMLLQREGLI